MRFFLGRTEIRVSAAMIPFFIWCIVIGEGRLLLLGLISLTVHECAHLIAARNLGYQATRLAVYPIGAVLQFRPDTVESGTEWIAAAAGPLASAALAAFLFLIRTVCRSDSDLLHSLQTVNFSIAVLNLIPAFPLDGGRILRPFLQKILRERTSKRILLSFTFLTSLAFLASGISLLSKGVLSAWTFPAFSLFLTASAILEWKTPDPGNIGSVLNRSRAIRRGESRKAVFVVLSSEATVGDAVAAISGSCVTFLRIADGNSYYELSENDLLREAGRFGYREPLKSLISSLTGNNSCVIIH